MTWHELTEKAQLAQLDEESRDKAILIFKHSTSCSISSMVLNRLERSWNAQQTLDLRTYFLDLHAHREVSNAVAKHYGVQHESPQAILIVSGQVAYQASHTAISYADIISAIPKTEGSMLD